MIYLDQAATSFPKPGEVVEAVVRALRSAGSSARGGHELSLAASRLVFQARLTAAEFFGAADPSRIAFTANATESLNLALFGLLEPGDHVITTAQEHNSVLRPLFLLERRGVDLTIVPVDRRGVVDLDQLKISLRPGTKAVVVTHGSNLTGNLLDLDHVMGFCREHELILILDAAQTAGWYPYNLTRQPIDVLCFTGHKALYGPQGTGGIYIRPGLQLKPLKVGGSGTQTFAREHPREMPEALEAGTLNTPGIAGLAAGIAWVQSLGLERIRQREAQLTRYFHQRVQEIPGVELYGDFSAPERLPIVTLNLPGLEASLVSGLLAQEGICTRSGGHCAPLLHRALGTEERGAVRFSFSHVNTEAEIDVAVEALQRIAQEYGGQ
ncbi:MAG: aminotransferase class V-fold PLP-dependent enzyme [Limnochordia bacterium]|jgi:cysteine desulfurase family protein|nr:aminotransferase class V-fold PLP-dependent enzyme [Limnochordia bacterium]MDI9465039.1 aminotransferase class V-fold PLP-dependent enzyme [Bacillota bacterium]NLO96154.1 aminotransferase class V-fold PLP-dependent enzyme [Bacillota bacterium]HAI52225.1 cysteine desulfurase [Bacillota bacterium]HAN94816.1 cysteine desulfurase [Bacillota bacterium]